MFILKLLYLLADTIVGAYLVNKIRSYGSSFLQVPYIIELIVVIICGLGVGLSFFWS